MEILIKVIQFLLSISILVILHEAGHFVFARIFKTRVEKFYLFFNPWFSLFKARRGDTEYGIGWLPLGGYVKIAGMIDESLDKEQLKQPPQPWEFRSKPAWQRLFIMLGGVLVNFLLAFIIYISVLYVWGEDYLPTQNARYGIMADSLALQIGLQNGDHIVAIDNKPVEDFHDIVKIIALQDARSIQVMRDSQLLTISIPDTLVSVLLKKPRFVDVRIPFVVGDFTKNSIAREAGFQKEDSLVAINGERYVFFDEFRSAFSRYKGDSITVTVVRKGSPVDIHLRVPETGLLGIYPVGDLSRFFQIKHLRYGFFAAIPAGIQKGYQTSIDYIRQFKLIFSRKTKGYESLGGFITIGSIFPGQWDWQAFWSMTAFLSIILAIMNILPIPALDGGHVLFLLFEIVTGRKPGDKFLEYAQIVGMSLLLALILYANLNDIIKLFR